MRERFDEPYQSRFKDLAGVLAIFLACIVAWRFYEGMAGPSWLRWLVAIWIFGLVAMTVALTAQLYLSRAEIPQTLAQHSAVVHLLYWGCIWAAVVVFWPASFLWLAWQNLLRHRR